MFDPSATAVAGPAAGDADVTPRGVTAPGPAASAGTEVTDVLVAMSDQLVRWQSELAQAQAQVRSLLGPGGPATAGDGTVRLTTRQATALVEDLLARGARRISYVRPSDHTSLLDGPKTRAAVLAHPRVSALTLVSRPTAVPRTIAGQSHITVRATWTELREIGIIDDTVALIPSAGPGEQQISLVRQPVVVGQLVQFFDAAWVQAANRPVPEPARDVAEAELKQRILLLLAEGVKDETVARRLGISLRTCRRHVAELLEQMGSSSRFQAGFRAALLGMIPVPPPERAGGTRLPSPPEPPARSGRAPSAQSR